jgi:Lon-like ATP-dependent protease
VRSKTAVTGSISLSGQILPVGGIMAKVRVAIDSGCTDVVIPKANMGDFLSLPESERKKITVHPVEDIEEAVAFLLPEATL